MGKPRKIMVLTRLTEYCREAVNYGVSIARNFNAQLYVMHVVAEPHALDQEALNAPEIVPDGRHKTYMSRQQEAKDELDRVLRRELESGLPIEVMVKEGSDSDEIVKIIKDRGIDLLIALAHEEGRFEHMLFGGDNDPIIRKMPCSILLVKKEPEPVEW